MKTKLAVAVLVAVVAHAAKAGPLNEARVNKIINDVAVVDPANGARAAALNEVIKGQTGIKTGIKSRSELLFQDNTLTRIGPETFFSFTPGTREMTLKEGAMLLQVPKGLGGAKIRTAAVTAAITGTTIMLEHKPGKNIKVLVLEGSLRLSTNGAGGNSVVLTPGRMVSMPPDATKIPAPITVDLAQVVGNSGLVKMGDSDTASLPSMPLIEQEIAGQIENGSEHRLTDASLIIDGDAGTNATVAAADRRTASVDTTLASIPTPTAAPTAAPTATPLPTPMATPVPLPTATPLPSAAPLPSATPLPVATPAPVATPPPTPTDDNDDDDDNDELNTVDLSPGHHGPDDVSIDTPIDLSAGGNRGKVKAHADGTITVNTSIKVSESAGPTPSRSGGTIYLRSDKRNGVAINVTNSAQLLSLLDAAAPGPGGSIRFIAAGGDVNVNGATMQADRGRIDIKNNGENGRISLNAANLRADTVKVRTHGRNGELNIGGGTISADTLIWLYSSGSNGSVNFTDNVTLSGTSLKTIWGQTVTIADGKVVTVNGSGPARVFTSNPNYTGSGGNGSTTGTFGGQGATTTRVGWGGGD